MNDSSSESLRRAFAAAPEVGADETFVAVMAAKVAVRRQRRRAAMFMLWGVVVLALSVLLAPFAPSVGEISASGVSLLELPAVASGAFSSQADTLSSAVRLPLYLQVLTVLCGVLAIAVVVIVSRQRWPARR